MSNSFGRRFRITTWGESHGRALGVVIDGCPAGLKLDGKALRAFVARSVPDRAMGTARREPNQIQILSGLFRGRTLGTPLSIVIPNRDVQSAAYGRRRSKPRPGHADLTWSARFGHVDWRGGGRSSGRECIARLAAGAVAMQLLARLDVTLRSEILSLAGISVEEEGLEAARAAVLAAARHGDSTGGRVRVVAEGLPRGLGSPVFGKLSADLAAALASIGGVKALAFGAGDAFADWTGAEAHDAFVLRDGAVVTATNRCGGLLGGMTTGAPLTVDLSVKATPSHGRPVRTVDLEGLQEEELELEGRFDANFAPRVAVIAEAMTACVLVDALLESGHLHPTMVEGGAE